MPMPKWRHIYSTTTTVNIPGKGPTALRPQDEFRAPRATVKHLLKIKRVVGPLPEPPVVEEKADAPKPTPQSPKVEEEAAPVADDAEPHGDANVKADVVASEPSFATTEPTAETGAETSRSNEEKGKEKENRPRRKKSKRSRS